jgi:hypothetical protein
LPRSSRSTLDQTYVPGVEHCIAMFFCLERQAVGEELVDITLLFYSFCQNTCP